MMVGKRIGTLIAGSFSFLCILEEYSNFVAVHNNDIS